MPILEKCIEVFWPYYDGRKQYMIKLGATILLEKLEYGLSWSYTIAIKCMKLDQWDEHEALIQDL